MTPAEAAVRAASQRRVHRPDAAPAPGERRPDLSVVERTGSARRRRRPVTELLALAVVTGALVAVVVGHSMLAQGQVRLSGLQSQLALEQAKNRQLGLAVAGLETPSRVVSEAEQQLHMVVPPAVQQLPAVPLTTPLPAPHVLPSTATTVPPHASSGSTGAASSGTGSTGAASSGNASSGNASSSTGSGGTTSGSPSATHSASRVPAPPRGRGA